MNPPTQPSATPRTDAATNYCDANPVMPWVSADFARTLETELAAAKAECERLKEDSAVHRMRIGAILWSGALDKKTCGDVQTWADEYTAELARLRADFASMTMQAATAADRNVGLRLDADRLRAENDELKRIHELNKVLVTELHDKEARAERAELALANARCPHIVSTNEGTHYCAVAESTVAEARKDSERFNLLATLLEDVNIGGIDPTKHRTEDNEWPDAWRAAIDAAMTTSNQKTT